MQEKKQRKSIGQCKCCGLHFFDDINKEQLCESCSRFIADYTKQVRNEVCEEIMRLSAIDVVNKQYIIETEILDQISTTEKI